MTIVFYYRHLRANCIGDLLAMKLDYTNEGVVVHIDDHIVLDGSSRERIQEFVHIGGLYVIPYA